MSRPIRPAPLTAPDEGDTECPFRSCQSGANHEVLTERIDPFSP